MIFKKLAMEYAQFDLDNIVDLKSMLDENCLRHEGPMGDMQAKHNNPDGFHNSQSYTDNNFGSNQS